MPIDYDPRTALIVVDMQEDFASPNGNLYVSDAEHILGRVNTEIIQAREAGALIVYTQDWHPPDTPHFAKDGGVWPVHCVRDTPGAELVAGLEREPSGQVVRKGAGGEDGYSGFSMRDPETNVVSETRLARLLEGRSIQHVVIAGLATDYCVRATALDARRLGYEATVIEDAVRAVDLQPGDGASAIDEMRDAGVNVV